MSIILDPKHGVNPSVYQCFFCGKDIGLILVGNKARTVFGNRARADGEAPMHAGALDYEPCEECKGHMRQGIICISVRDGESGNNPYRTGGWCVVREEAVRRIFTGAVVEDICRRRMVFVPDQVWDAVGLPRATKQ